MGEKLIIGLSGWASSGKDEVAKILVKDFGYTKIALADPLRKALYTLNPFIRDNNRLAEVVDYYGWDYAKQIPEVRRLLQVFGSEIGRNMISSDLWVEMALNSVHISDKVVISDIRFPNEFDEVKWMFGEVWRVNRPSIDPVNRHESETALDDFEFDRVIDNEGSLDDLYAAVLSAME